jgi:hypothetical protein
MLSYKIGNCMTGHACSFVFLTARLELLEHRNRGEGAASLVKI